jgi:signal transduction histidine kinase
MRERVQGFKGSFSVDSEVKTDENQVNKGTTIHINIPQAIDIRE